MENAFDHWKELDAEQKRALRIVKQKYQGNPWWKSDDPATILRYQIEEPTQVVSAPDYIDMLGRFLERPVCHLEIAFNYPAIREEVRLALGRREMGIGQSEEQRETAHRHYARRLKEIVRDELPRGRTIIINTD